MSIIRTNYFSRGAYVKSGEPYHEMKTFDNIPLSAVKNAGKMIGKHNKELATIYYVELHNEIYHGTRREYAAPVNGCKEFEEQFPVFPYSEDRFKLTNVEKEVALLRKEIVRLSELVQKLSQAGEQ